MLYRFPFLYYKSHCFIFFTKNGNLCTIFKRSILDSLVSMQHMQVVLEWLFWVPYFFFCDAHEGTLGFIVCVGHQFLYNLKCSIFFSFWFKLQIAVMMENRQIGGRRNLLLFLEVRSGRVTFILWSCMVFWSHETSFKHSYVDKLHYYLGFTPHSTTQEE
jgi:hypothetical protein